MKSKTSYFNKTIFVKNMFRFWPIWVLYLAILIFSMPVNLFVMTHPPITDPYKLQALSVALGWRLRTLPLCVFALLSAIAVFSYLYSARSCDTLHAMPLQRRELFHHKLYFRYFVFVHPPDPDLFMHADRMHHPQYHQRETCCCSG